MIKCYLLIIKIKHQESDMCLESSGENGGYARMKMCHGLGSLQVKIILF